MSSKSYIVLVLSFFIISLKSLAQENAILNFATTTYNFGSIKEESDPVEYEFNFVNSGNAPLVITSVDASCGCTTTGWSTDSIMPGKSGFVKASFDPNNRPGPFNKTITINSNAEPAIAVLSIEGYVKPKPKNPEQDLPVKSGKLRVRNKIFNLGNITTVEPVVKDFDIFNDSDSPISFLEKYEAPAHIKLLFEPKILQPRERGIVWVRYDALAKQDFGFVSDHILIRTSDTDEPEKSFSIYATIEEYFPPMNEVELAKAPKLTFNGILYDFGAVKKGQVITIDFPFANTGGDDLNIRAVKSNCNCLNYSLVKRDYKKGESGIISLTLDTKGRDGTQIKTVTLFSNDPLKPTQVLTIKAVVK
jgi:hypothetical protein